MSSSGTIIVNVEIGALGFASGAVLPDHMSIATFRRSRMTDDNGNGCNAR